MGTRALTVTKKAATTPAKVATKPARAAAKWGWNAVKNSRKTAKNYNTSQMHKAEQMFEKPKRLFVGTSKRLWGRQKGPIVAHSSMDDARHFADPRRAVRGNWFTKKGHVYEVKSRHFHRSEFQPGTRWARMKRSFRPARHEGMWSSEAGRKIRMGDRKTYRYRGKLPITRNEALILGTASAVIGISIHRHRQSIKRQRAHKAQVEAYNDYYYKRNKHGTMFKVRKGRRR